MRRPLVFVASLTLAAVAACAGEREAGPHPDVVVDTIGDTVVVHTLAGSAWGGDATLVAELVIGEMEGDLEYLFGQIASIAVGADGTIYVVDRQVPELRAYGPDGVFRAVIGPAGEGPGELKGPDGGLAVLSDGRILVRDPGNARIQVYSPEAEALDAWPHRGGFFTSTPMYRDRRDNVYVSTLMDPQADIRDWVIGLARISPDGLPGDTLLPPDGGYEAPALEARSPDGSGVSRTSVPFAPTEEWTLHVDGYFLHGISTEYRIDVLNPEGPVRIIRRFEPVPIAAAERAEEEARISRNMRRTQPGWRWSGPAIPDQKPPFRDIYAGRDGRIWVSVSLPSYERDDPDYDATDPEAVEDRWRDGVGFDVFEPDGTYLGRVTTPEGFATYPTPIFNGELVWAAMIDDLGVHRVVRFRVARGP